MKGDIFTWQRCRCGGEWTFITDPVTKDTINITCGSCKGPPELVGVDGRAFKNRRGSVGRVTHDKSGEFIHSVYHARRILESIRNDWDTLGPERFDPSKHSKQGREKYALAECAREWMLNLKDRGKKDAHIAHVEIHFRLHIIPILGDLDIRSIVEDDAERLQRELMKKDGIGKNTVKACLQSLRTLLRRYHERKHLIDRMPAFPEGWSESVYVERHECTVKEQRRLMARLVMAYRKRDRRAMLRLQKVYVALGCRPGEAHGLRREDILEDGKVRISGAIDPVTGEYGPNKTKTVRTVDPGGALPKKLLAELRSLPVLPKGFLFTDAKGKPWNQNTVTKVFRKICDVPTVSYYTYSKHSLASRTVREATEYAKDRAALRVGVTRRVLDANYDLGRGK